MHIQFDNQHSLENVTRNLSVLIEMFGNLEFALNKLHLNLM